MMRHFLNAPRPTPEQLEGLRRDFIEQAFRALEPEHQAAMRQLSAAMPLPDADDLRKELADPPQPGAEAADGQGAAHQAPAAAGENAYSQANGGGAHALE
jgi:hypothetical protein